MVKSRIAVGLGTLTLCVGLPSRGIAERCGGTERPRDRRTDRVGAGSRPRLSLVPSSLLVAALLFATHAAPACGQANGKLQLHFMNVGQGDGALLVSPGGETVLFNNGVLNYCDLPLSYLQQLGVERIDYHIASHYHADHSGCTEEGEVEPAGDPAPDDWSWTCRGGSTSPRTRRNRLCGTCRSVPGHADTSGSALKS
jgi:hypothetical protein